MIVRYKYQKSKTSVLSHGFHVQMQDFFGERKRFFWWKKKSSYATCDKHCWVLYGPIEMFYGWVLYYPIQPNLQLSDGRWLGMKIETQIQPSISFGVGYILSDSKEWEIIEKIPSTKIVLENCVLRCSCIGGEKCILTSDRYLGAPSFSLPFLTRWFLACLVFQ